MPEFVREHRLYFVVREMLHQGIPQNDSLRFPDPCKTRICLLCGLTEIEGEYSRNIHLRILTQKKDAFLQSLVFQRGELIE